MAPWNGPNNLLTVPRLSLALSAKASVSADLLFGTSYVITVNRLNSFKHKLKSHSNYLAYDERSTD